LCSRKVRRTRRKKKNFVARSLCRLVAPKSDEGGSETLSKRPAAQREKRERQWLSAKKGAKGKKDALFAKK